MKKVTPLIMHAKKQFPNHSITWKIVEKCGVKILKITIKNYFNGDDVHMNLSL